MALKNAAGRMWRSLINKETVAAAPKDVNAQFGLFLNDSQIATLDLSGGQWTFRYTNEFVNNNRLRSLIEFPDVKKTYHTRDLWPFFALRIPSLSQSSVQAVLQSENIDEADELQLLRRFGRRTITSPFELIER